MKQRAQIQLLYDHRRLHLQDGPIDIVLEGFGSARQVEIAYRAAAHRFVTVLDELCEELSILRQPPTEKAIPLGKVAQHMRAAVLPYASQTFITPMAAVAGAVAEEILAAMTDAAELERAYVNDGGDIAIHLSCGQRFTVGMVDIPHRPSLFGSVLLDATNSVRGIATSGWGGRSFSLGIADAVTVLADRAANADAAATVIANAVDLPGHSGIVRVPACELVPDNDLGDRLVTQGVDALTSREIATALDSGVQMAHMLLGRGLIRAAALHLQGTTRFVGAPVCLDPSPQSIAHRSLVHA